MPPIHHLTMRRGMRLAVFLCVIWAGTSEPIGMAVAGEQARDHLRRAKVFLAAGDYRHAVEA